MDPRSRPYRSVLYIPGSKPRALDKARSLPVDAIIFDLEDAVTADEKVGARDRVAMATGPRSYGSTGLTLTGVGPMPRPSRTWM